MGNINASVDLRRDGEIAIVTVDNPPVNSLKHEVRAGLAEALRQTRDDAAVKALVVGSPARQQSFRNRAALVRRWKPSRPAEPATA